MQNYITDTFTECYENSKNGRSFALGIPRAFLSDSERFVKKWGVSKIGVLLTPCHFVLCRRKGWLNTEFSCR